MNSIAIIMSTYNGQQYITEQLQSILAQSHQDFAIFIRDDGSGDGTPSLLEEFSAADSRIHLVKDTDSSANINLGFGASFATAINCALADESISYFAFCDQDDFWEPDKLEVAINALSGKSSPCLFASNYYICDDKLNPQGVFCSGDPLDGVTFQNLFFEGVFPGFTLVMNRALAKLAFKDCDKGSIYYHDKWVSLIALTKENGIIYNPTPLARYRRHSAAASSTNLGFVAKLKWRINKVLNGDFCPRTRNMLSQFNKIFFDSLSPELQNFLSIYTGRSKSKKLFYPRRLRRSLSGEIMLRIIILLGNI